MTYTEEQLWTLLDQAHHMPYGPGQIALVEQVMTHADAQHLTELAFAARMQATSAYVYGGERARSFATFAWCLAEFDRNPAAYQYQYRSLLWHFKYMVSALTRFPEVPLERTYGVLDDMERRWRETGHTMHAVYAYRHDVAAHIGDLEVAEAYYVQWCAEPRDDLSDCVGCDPTSKAWWLATRGRDEEAVALGDSVLSGRLTCSEQPQSMLAALMVPYIKTGRLDQARDAHRRAYRLHRTNLADLGEIADHIEFCARTGNEARALEIVERHLGWLNRAPSPWAAMLFAASSSLALRRAQSRHDDGELTLHRPAYDDREAGRISAAALAEELTAQATEMADRFDRRNGTESVGTMVRETLAGEPWIEYLALSPTASPARPTAGSSTVEELFAKAPASTPAPPPPSPPMTVPETSGPEELLNLIDEYHEADDDERANAALDDFETQYVSGELTTRQRARLTDAKALRSSISGDDDGAIELWWAAVADYATDADADRQQRAMARIGSALCRTDRAEEGLPIIRAATERLLASPDQGTRVAAALRLANCFVILNDPQSALTALDRAEVRPEDAPIQARARHAVDRAFLLLGVGRIEDVLRLTPAAITLAEEAGLADALATGHAARAAALERVGRYQEALHHVDAAMAHATDDEMRSGLDLVRVTILPHTDQAASAIDDLIAGIAASTARGDHAKAADLRHALAVAYLNANRLLDAADVAEEELAYRLADKHSLDGMTHVMVREILATIYQRLGQPTEAVAQLDAMAAEIDRDGHRASIGMLAQRSGEILYDANLHEAAAARFLTAADAFAELGQPIRELHNRWRQADSFRRAALVAEAVAALTAADAVAAGASGDDANTRWELAALDFSAARILRAAGRLMEAAPRAERAARAAATFDGPAFTAESHQLLSAILLGLGRAAEAEAAIHLALAVLPDGADRESYDQLLEAARAAQGNDPHEEAGL